MAIKIEAAARLATLTQAAKADQDAAMKLLKSLGFKGLSPKSDEEDVAKFHYTDWDQEKVEKKLGAPKDNKSDSIRYKYGSQGVVAVWPNKGYVTLRNSARN